MAEDTNAFIAKLLSQLSPAIQGMVKGSCEQILARSGQAALPATAGGPAVAGPRNLNIPGCPVVCDPCLNPYMEEDARLSSWPELEAQMYATFTRIDQILVGGPFPLAAGTSITLEQQASRTITFIPDLISVVTTWSGGPAQDGLLSLQWAVGPKGTVTGQVLFGEEMDGSQFKCGDNCEKQPFPEWRGCSNLPIGPLSSLRMIASLDQAATSVLESINVVAYHRRSVKKSCCGGCSSGGSCGC